MEELENLEYEDRSGGGQVLDAVRSLPEKYRIVIYLHYYEGYSAREIGAMMKMKENTVYTNLSRGREELKHMLGGESIG